VVGLFIVYLDAYHDLSASEGLILLAAYLSRVLAAPLALVLIRRWERRRFWVATALANAALYSCLFFLPQGPQAFVWLVGFAIAAGVLDCILGILSLMLLGDVIDDDARRTQRDKAASYKAAVNLADKTLRAVGLSGGLVVAGTAGLVVGGVNTPEALLALLFLLAAAPAFLNLVAAWGMSELRFGSVTPQPKPLPVRLV
jgi:Na+/melibiose symporter-like transporter